MNYLNSIFFQINSLFVKHLSTRSNLRPSSPISNSSKFGTSRPPASLPFLQISFNVTVTAEACMGEQHFTISPLGIKDTLKVTLSTTCDCQCDDPQDNNHPQCNLKGKVNCGICRYVSPGPRS